MNCNCIELKTNKFDTEKNYINFLNQLEVLKKNGQFIECGEVEPKSPFLQVQYLCKRCGKKWVLKSPDQAFRGGWYELK